jgi:tetratricopeptide (TPR) repeat protein
MTTTLSRPVRSLGKQAPPGRVPAAKQILSNAQAGRAVIQEFAELASSLEWQLGQEYLRERGNKSFISDVHPVPFVVNNDSTLSTHAAEVFFTSLIEADQAGTLEADIYVLELGVGVGLFARFFLDHFRDLCDKHRKDFYDRLCYIAGDKSERMLMDVCRHGVFANHPGRYRLRVVDALEPGKVLAYDVAFSDQRSVVSIKGARDREQGTGQTKAFRAVFLNYLLDCLPAAVLEIDGDKTKQLCVRTCLARNVNLADFTDMSLGQLQERAAIVAGGKGAVAGARRELLEVYGLFASEYDYRPVDYRKLPHGEFAFEYARRWSKRLLLSYGAIQCLEGLLDLVHDEGFILINDYGQTQMNKEEEFEHQRFSLATFVGLNFPLLKEYFTRGAVSEQRSAVSEQQSAISEQQSAVNDEPAITTLEGSIAGEGPPPTTEHSPLATNHSPLTWLEPFGEGDGIHARLLGRRPAGPVRERFQVWFGKAAQEKLQEPGRKARECVKVGRFELAADFYNQALDLQPRNWVLLNEISMFLTFSLRDPRAGIDMAKLALALNPACSSELWSTLGDGLFEFGRLAEARQAYRRAIQVNAADVRARYNLAWVHAREKNFPAALEMIAQAFALDKTGEYRERLLQKLNEVLGLLSVRNQQEYLLLINLVSKFSTKEEGAKEEDGVVAGA